MKINAFLKGLLMALVGFVATTVSDLETMNVAYIVIASIGFTVIYVGKNYLFPSKSVMGLDWQDIISGFVIAIGMGLSSAAAQVLTTEFEWNTLWIAVSGAAIGYVTKTLPSKAK